MLNWNCNKAAHASSKWPPLAIPPKKLPVRLIALLYRDEQSLGQKVPKVLMAISLLSLSSCPFPTTTLLLPFTSISSTGNPLSSSVFLYIFTLAHSYSSFFSLFLYLCFTVYIFCHWPNFQTSSYILVPYPIQSRHTTHPSRHFGRKHSSFICPFFRPTL